MKDRIGFAKVLLDSINPEQDLAKEMCIVKYFNELMVFYNLVELNDHEHNYGIQDYWFENTNKFCMKIKFSSHEKIKKFCDELTKCDGHVFIYGLYYKLTYITKNTICTLVLDCQHSPCPNI